MNSTRYAACSLLLCLGIVTSTPLFSAETFFKNCEDVLRKPMFAQLSKLYLPRGKNLQTPDMCSRLDNNEFLVTVTDSGRIGQGLYYYNARTGFFDFPDGKYRQGIQIENEFLGPNSKRFVLIKSFFMHQGAYANRFEILNLVPRNDDRPFVLYTLIDAFEDPVSGLCGESIKDGLAMSIGQYKIANANSENIRLTFSVQEEDCVTRKTHIKQKVFTLVGGRFTELPRPTNHSTGPAAKSAAGR